MTERIRVASVEDLPPGEAKEVVAGGRVIALFNIDGQIHAIDGICAHAGGPVAKGTVAGSIVTSGQNCLNAGICQRPFPVTVEDSGIFVEVDPASPST